MNGYAQAYSDNLQMPCAADAQSAEARSANRILRRNEHLIHAGDQIKHAYVVVSGVLKSYINYENGDSQVLGFHIPGDIIGHESLMQGRSFCGVIALDTSSVRRLEATSGATSQALVESMHSEIQRLTRQLHLERECSTAARLATFLLDYSESQAQRGYCRYEFILPMGRRDLAGYLGLATETLSRVFSRFRDQGILRVNTNHVIILDPTKLEAASGTAAEESRLIC